MQSIKISAHERNVLKNGKRLSCILTRKRRTRNFSISPLPTVPHKEFYALWVLDLITAKCRAVPLHKAS